MQPFTPNLNTGPAEFIWEKIKKYIYPFQITIGDWSLWLVEIHQNIHIVRSFYHDWWWPVFCMARPPTTIVLNYYANYFQY